MNVGLLWLALGLTLSGCISDIEQEKSSIGRVERDCVVPAPPGVRALSAPVALEYPHASLWIWEELSVDGRVVATPAAWVGSVDALCESGPTLLADSTDEPATLLALTDDELAQNEARADGRKLALAPQGGFVHEGTGYLFYEQVLRGPDVLDAELLGTGVCVLAPESTSCERVGLPDQTLLFDAHARALNRGGLVHDDRALIYGCRPVAELSQVCTVAGAPLERLSEPAAYELYSTFNGWQREPVAAASLVDELGSITVSAFRDEYLMTVLDIFEARIYVRRAALPTGEFGRRVAAFDLLAPEAWFPGGGREHSGLRPSADNLVVSYTTDKPQPDSLHVVSFRFFGNLGP